MFISLETLCHSPYDLVLPADAEEDAADSKENRQQAGNVMLPQPGVHDRQSGQSNDLEHGKRLSSGSGFCKTRKSARLSGTRTSPSSARQDSEEADAEPDQLTAQRGTHAHVGAQDLLSQGTSAAEPATQDPDAQDSIAESAVRQFAEPVSHELPAGGAFQTAVTPVKAAQAKASGDVQTFW